MYFVVRFYIVGLYWGDCFYLIQSGRVQLVKCVNGAKKNLDILKPGEFFGEMAILENKARSGRKLKPLTEKQLLSRAEKSNKDYHTGKFKTQEVLEKESENW